MGESCFYNRCIDGSWSGVLNTDEGLSCVENKLVESTICETPPFTEQCNFSGIRCLADEEILVDGVCTTRYQECVDFMLSPPVVLPGITDVVCHN